ncbi:MAG: IS1634 family transposase [Candidatus Eremiobacteraeota bacterium]|nr:IS1634 family transposase [Candidatus Eremiobacteraeota bacterium]MDQ7822540.1 IS1634 family transposase [Candidatus Eremiobacteraeota bacterium]
MFIRVKKVTSGRKQYDYLQICETSREDKKVRQKVIATLGTMDELVPSGQLDRFVESMAKFSQNLQVLNLHQEGALSAEWSKSWGPSLIFRRLWEQLQIPEIIKAALTERAFQFDVEKTLFAIALQRLVKPGSDLLGSSWVKRAIYGEGLENIGLQHFYRALGFLAGKKEYVEDQLFERRRHMLINEVDIVFFDTSTLYFEGKGPKNFAKRGFSKDGHAQDNQIVFGVVMSREGTPLSCMWWPGNTADVETIRDVASSLKKRFYVKDVVLVCDRGMVSAKNLKRFTALGFKYIVGMKMRKTRHVKTKVMGKRGRYLEVRENLRVKEVSYRHQRYVLCYNPQEAERDKKKREAILDDLREKLAGGEARSLIGNKGYRAYLSVEREALHIDELKVQREARYDGKYVLRTNTDLPKEKVALTYKGLQDVEALFRDLKDILEARPFFHRKEDMVKAHLFSCFLALQLMVELKKRLESESVSIPWKEIILRLEQISAVKVNVGDSEFLLRTEFPPGVNDIFRAAGVRPPPRAQLISPQKACSHKISGESPGYTQLKLV